jgi:hypothetical protein
MHDQKNFALQKREGSDGTHVPKFFLPSYRTVGGEMEDIIGVGDRTFPLWN